jgi:Cd2+/Zn2+-exporting ATPase
MGSDAAIETADVALMSDDLSKLSWLVRHSRATLAVIRQNVAFSIAVKLLFTALTVIGLASLWGAIAADVGASLLVVLNGLRLLNRGQTISQKSGPSGGLGVSAHQHRAPATTETVPA